MLLVKYWGVHSLEYDVKCSYNAAMSLNRINNRSVGKITGKI